MDAVSPVWGFLARYIGTRAPVTIMFAIFLTSACRGGSGSDDGDTSQSIAECETLIARSRSCLTNLDSQAATRADALATAMRQSIYASINDEPSRELAREKCVANLTTLGAGCR